MRTFKEWKQFIELKKAGETQPNRNRQSMMIQSDQFKAVSGVIEGKVGDSILQKKLRNQFNVMPRYHALGAVFSQLEKTTPSLAVEIAEAAAGLDFKLETGT